MDILILILALIVFMLILVSVRVNGVKFLLAFVVFFVIVYILFDYAGINNDSFLESEISPLIE
jgi:hypothetical protein